MATKQLHLWQSEFGDAYTERNQIDWRLRLKAWEKMLENLRLQHVIEVGPNRGHNLRAIAELGTVMGNLLGIEPNATAVQIARENSTAYAVLQGDVFSLPFVDGYADLVFTAGVLIHIAPPDLPKALAEIYRVSGHYILCIEYFAEVETVIHYRGHDDLLWKRDFRALYQAQFPQLRVVKAGYWEQADGFDRSHWWLFEK